MEKKNGQCECDDGKEKQINTERRLTFAYELYMYIILSAAVQHMPLILQSI